MMMEYERKTIVASSSNQRLEVCQCCIRDEADSVTRQSFKETQLCSGGMAQG